MLWCMSGLAEFWALTLEEPKRLLEVAIDEARAINPDVVVLAPELLVWECDTTVHRAGWLRDGIVCAAQLGTAAYLFETPQRRLFTEYWNLVWDGMLIEAMDYARTTGMDQFELGRGPGTPAIRVGRTTSPTGVGRSSTRPRCSACQSVRTRIPDRRRRSSQPRPRLRSARRTCAPACAKADRATAARRDRYG